MIVWMVESYVDYEGGSVEGLFSTEEKAKAYVEFRKEEKRKHDDPDANYYSTESCWWDDIDYYQCVVE